MGKITRIDLSGDRLVSIAMKMADDHNFVGALKMLNKHAACGEVNPDALSLYAEIYDDLGLYEKCINGWFAYLDNADYDDLTDCFEGLAVSYMNMGMDNFAAFYYSRLIEETGGVSAEEKESILRDFLSQEENPLKFVYPPKIADCSEIISEGISKMKSGDFESAIRVFDGVDEENPSYVPARNYVAMCRIVLDNLDEAEQECKNILKTHPQNVQALTTLAACYSERGETEAAVNLAKMLIGLDVDDQDEIYKIATVCCENKLHGEAYTLFSKLTGEIIYDKNIMFFKAVSAYDCGKTARAFDEFDRLLAIYPEAVTARYYYEKARRDTEEGNFEELGYFYRLPQEEREHCLGVISCYVANSKAKAKLTYPLEELERCINWCFDEVEAKSGGDLQRVALHAAVKCGLDGLIKKHLLDAFLPDEIKIELLASLTGRNTTVDTGVVICNVYKRYYVEPLSVGRVKKKSFTEAYASLCSHFAILDGENAVKFKYAAERIYLRLEELEKLGLAGDNSALSAAIYTEAGVREAGITGKKIYSFFEVTEERVNRILEVL